MPIAPDVSAAYLHRAFDQMEGVLGRLSDDELTTVPFGDATSSISGLVTHCTELTPFWLGHVGLGEPTARDRGAEFTHQADRSELTTRITDARTAIVDHLARLAGGQGRPSDMRAFLYGDQSDDALVLHVVEELYQHVGHMDLTADALVAGRSSCP